MAVALDVESLQMQCESTLPASRACEMSVAKVCEVLGIGNFAEGLSLTEVKYSPVLPRLTHAGDFATGDIRNQ